MNSKSIKLNNTIRKIISFLLTLVILAGTGKGKLVSADTFTYSWIGSSSESGSYTYGDGTIDGAGWGYYIRGAGIVFCINQGSLIYDNDNYDESGNDASFFSEGKSDMSYEAVVAKICFYWSNNTSSSFARSLTQALLWQTMDKGYYSKKSIKSILSQSSGDTDKLYEEIFAVNKEISATVKTYRSSTYGNTQRMALINAEEYEDNLKFSYARYRRSMSYRQIISLHKTDTSGNPIEGVVYAIRLDGRDYLNSVTIQRGTLLLPKDIEDVNKGMTEVCEVDTNGNVMGTNVTKSKDQIEDMYKRAAGTVVIFIKTDKNGDARIRLSYKVFSGYYAYGRYKKDGEDTWTVVKTSGQVEELSDNSNDDVMYNGHTYMYWMKKAFNDSGKEGGFVAFRNRALCNAHGLLRMDANGDSISGSYSDLRNVYENVEDYIGVMEVPNGNGNTYYDNTLSINPDLDKAYKWIKITKDNSYLSVTDGLLGSEKKDASYSEIGSFSSGNGGSYTNSDYVDRDSNKWLSLSLQEDNDNYYSIDGCKVTCLDLSGNGSVVNAYYDYGMDYVDGECEVERSISIHKSDEDGNPIKGAAFEISINLGEIYRNLEGVIVNGEVINITDADDSQISENIQNGTLGFNGITDNDGLITIKLLFKKQFDGYSYGYGKYYNYSLKKYEDIENVSKWSSLSNAQKSGVKEVVLNALRDGKFTWASLESLDIESGKKLATDKLNKDKEDFREWVEKTEITSDIKEIDVYEHDELTINKDCAEGMSVTDGEIYITDWHKYYSVKLIKKDSDIGNLLTGAKFEIYEDPDFTIPAVFYDEKGNILNPISDNIGVNGDDDNRGNGAGGDSVYSAITYTTVDGSITTDYLRCDGKKIYYVKEVKAPDGYLSIYDDLDKENDVITFFNTGEDIDDLAYYSDEVVSVEILNKPEEKEVTLAEEREEPVKKEKKKVVVVKENKDTKKHRTTPVTGRFITDVSVTEKTINDAGLLIDEKACATAAGNGTKDERMKSAILILKIVYVILAIIVAMIVLIERIRRRFGKKKVSKRRTGWKTDLK